jgi:hypothetical protein
MQQLNGAWFELTPHATRRALDMALDPDDIRECLGNPRHVKPGLAGREMWVRGKIAAVLRPDDGFWVVITFMWSTANGWAMEAVRSRPEGLSAERDRAQRYAMKMTRKGRYGR